MSRSSDAQRWDERYRSREYVFGTLPNDFLASVLPQLPKGRALCLAAGEGRNSVFLAQHGYSVTAVDLSPVGLTKAERLAEERGVGIQTAAADLAQYSIEPRAWDLIVLIFAHLEPSVRQSVHRAATEGLRPGGALVLEAFTPEQEELTAVGPAPSGRLMGIELLRDELRGLRLEVGREVQREIQEGTAHHGVRSVVQVLAVKPVSSRPPAA